jgi:hypothetical protein
MGSEESSRALGLDERVTERSAGPTVIAAEDTAAFHGSERDSERLNEGLGSSWTKALTRPSEKVVRTSGARPPDACNGIAGIDIRSAHRITIMEGRVGIV